MDGCEFWNDPDGCDERMLLIDLDRRSKFPKAGAAQIREKLAAQRSRSRSNAGRFFRNFSGYGPQENSQVQRVVYEDVQPQLRAVELGLQVRIGEELRTHRPVLE